MKKIHFALILFMVFVYGCKKSCITCTDEPYYERYDSSINVTYNSSTNHYDTILVKIDTLVIWGNRNILHFCPGSASYNGIIGGTGVPLSYYNPANYQSYYCSYDQ
jgi:hypothetical protein